MATPLLFIGGGVLLALALEKRGHSGPIPGAGAEGTAGGAKESSATGSTLSMTSSGQPVTITQTDAGPMAQPVPDDTPLPDQPGVIDPTGTAGMPAPVVEGVRIGTAISATRDADGNVTIDEQLDQRPGATYIQEGSFSLGGRTLAQRQAAIQTKVIPVATVPTRGLTKTGASKRIDIYNKKTRSLAF